MDVSISARHVDVTPRLEEVIHEKIGHLDRYLEGLDYAGVHFDEARNPRIADKEVCEVVLKGNGHHLRCKVHAPDPFTAVDLATAKLERQIRKLRTKLHNRHHGKGDTIRNGGAVPTSTEVTDLDLESGADDVAPTPEIVKTKRFHLGPLTPVEAVEKMENLGHGFFFFINKDTNRSAVVYKRDDGDVGLIDEAG
jgi:putative sigma-54 modulation protein